MPPLDPSCLRLAPTHLHTLQALLARYAPSAVAWAYSSRVTGGAHEGSDLDLALRNSTDPAQPVEGWLELKTALQESDLPILVDVHLWAYLPDAFHRVIEQGYVVVQGEGWTEY